jgi:hypothetical protein
MIGSFGSVLVSVHVSVKMPGFGPPDGNPVVSTGTVDVAPEPGTAVADDEDAAAVDEVADARLTATRDETAAADAAARTTAPAAAAITKGSLMDMHPVNVRTHSAVGVLTLPEQAPSKAPTIGWFC